MENLTCSRNLKIEILKLLSAEEDKLFKHINAVNFFDEILNLRVLPSTDSRYKDAKSDFVQHFINNDDWTLEEIFLDRFNFSISDETFFKLLNFVISPSVNKTEEEIHYFYSILDSNLSNESLGYFVKTYDEAMLPIYIIDNLDLSKKFNEIPENTIPFFVNSEKNEYEPFFILKKNLRWNDFGLENSFFLSFYNGSEIIKIGELKIIAKTNISTTELIQESFTQLPSEYCSLAKDFSFYQKLKESCDSKFYSILKALNDAAFFIDIREEFENLTPYKSSLIRYPVQEQLIRQARYLINNYDLSDLYSFNYIFRPDYLTNNDALEIKFQFNNDKFFSNRMYALIGKNGVGKTQLVSKLPLDIAHNKKDNFSPKPPIFSKVIAVSYSVFDKFIIPKKSSFFSYVYCGLRGKRKNKEYTLSPNELFDRFSNSIIKIKNNDSLDIWCEIMSQFFSTDLVHKWLEIDSYGQPTELKLKEFKDDQKTFSSGQSIFVYVFTEILANIRYDSLILFDEPETHLHPNAISQLINSIHILLDRFQSYCIIATHSSIIVQGILSKNVFVLKNEQNVMSIRHPEIETFGENLTKITEDIFGGRDTQSYYRAKLEKLVKSGKSYDEIVLLLSSNNVPLSLNASILLNNLVNKDD